MGLEFPTNLLISGKSSSKILFAGTEETEETVSESVFSSEGGRGHAAEECEWKHSNIVNGT